jgi:hypothetical protein
MPTARNAMTLILDDVELLELTRILMDDDAEAALDFLKRHLKARSKELLEGG